MKSQQQLSATIHPSLSPKVRLQIDPATQQPILLYPEGIVKLNETAASIIRLCDGQRSFDEIIRELSRHYQVKVEVLRDEVSKYLLRLQHLSLLSFLP